MRAERPDYLLSNCPPLIACDYQQLISASVRCVPLFDHPSAFVTGAIIATGFSFPRHATERDNARTKCAHPCARASFSSSGIHLLQACRDVGAADVPAAHVSCRNRYRGGADHTETKITGRIVLISGADGAYATAWCDGRHLAG